MRILLRFAGCLYQCGGWPAAGRTGFGSLGGSGTGIQSTDRLIPDDLIAIGEIGLAGEVRAVNHIQNRVSEAYRLGFVRCMVPRHNLSQLNTEQMPDLEVIPVSSINEACKIIGRNKTE